MNLQSSRTMVVTPSRLHAVRYVQEFKRQIKEKGLNDLEVLVAFSGEVKDNDDVFTEEGMNKDKEGNANSTFNELVVMSPFLSESVIADFNLTDRALSDCKRTLVTRRSELGKLKASDVDNFTIYALKDEIIDGEEEISDELADKKKQDIHAKIYLRRKYSDVDLYLGSMNASYSAINKNVEMMLWLGTKNMYLNGDKFLEDIFCGPVGDAKNPFEQVTVADAVLETESDNRNLLEQKIKDLCRVKRQAVISEDNENAGKYKIEVEFSGIESGSQQDRAYICHGFR